MKKTFLVILSLFSLSAFASETAFWIDAYYCGELNLFRTRDACVMELNNQSENFAVITQQVGAAKELAHFDIAIINTKDLKPAKRTEQQVVKEHIREGLKVFTIDATQVRFRSLPR